MPFEAERAAISNGDKVLIIGAVIPRRKKKEEKTVSRMKEAVNPNLWAVLENNLSEEKLGEICKMVFEVFDEVEKTHKSSG